MECSSEYTMGCYAFLTSLAMDAAGRLIVGASAIRSNVGEEWNTKRWAVAVVGDAAAGGREQVLAAGPLTLRRFVQFVWMTMAALLCVSMTCCVSSQVDLFGGNGGDAIILYAQLSNLPHTHSRDNMMQPASCHGAPISDLAPPCCCVRCSTLCVVPLKHIATHFVEMASLSPPEELHHHHYLVALRYIGALVPSYHFPLWAAVHPSRHPCSERRAFATPSTTRTIVIASRADCDCCRTKYTPKNSIMQVSHEART